MGQQSPLCGVRTPESAQPRTTTVLTRSRLRLGTGSTFKVEKADSETKEALVYRNHPTALPGPVRIYYGPGGAQLRPGFILIGRPWPHANRVVMEQMYTAVDTLLIVGDDPGWYRAGVVEVDSLSSRAAITHELCHSHQDAWEKSNDVKWVDTLEGEAFKVVREQDWLEKGKAGYDKIRSWRGASAPSGKSSAVRSLRFR